VIRAVGLILAESARVALAARAVTGLVLLLGFVVPASALAVAGRNVEGQAAVLNRLDDAGSRILTIVSEAGGPGLPAAAADRIASLEGVAWVLGLGRASDVRAGGGGGPVPLRAVRSIRAPVAVSGASRQGAFVSEESARRLGLAGGFGWLSTINVPVVGWFRAVYPLGALNTFAIVPVEDEEQPLERIIVAVSDVAWVEQTSAHLRDLIGGAIGDSVSIEWSPELLAARASVRDEVARRDRLLVLALLASAAILAGIVVFTWTLGARRDFGRRRALGASRSQLVLLVVTATAMPALAGAALGSLAGWAYLSAQLGGPADPRFALAVGTLAVLACCGASIPPALLAAGRDPLRVLRVP